MTEPGFVSGIDALLLHCAMHEVERSNAAEYRWDHAGHAISAIVLATAAVEAHIGEWLVKPAARTHFTAEESSRWRNASLPATKVCKTIVHKLHPAYDFSTAQWYFRLCGLYELRNSIVHYYPDHLPVGTWPDRLEPYVTCHVFDPGGDETMDWTSRMLLASVASQATEIAREAFHEFDQLLLVLPEVSPGQPQSLSPAS